MTQLTRPVTPQHDYAAEFHAMLDKWHAMPEVYDSELDAQYFEMLARRAREKGPFPTKPYFSPSAVSADPRMLYVKAMGAKKDTFGQAPHKGRWTRIGTAWGDVIQRDLLYIEKHWKRIFGEEPPFVPVRNQRGEPMWEDFVKKNHRVTHRGHTFHLYGKPDGILRHTATGSVVGLELKSKQTTSAKTSLYSMREAEDKHVNQTVGYALMYGVDAWIVSYGNMSKKTWRIPVDEYEKTPDLRVFQYVFTEEDKTRFLDKIADRMDEITAKTPPALDITEWEFNGFKTACALSLTDAELATLDKQVRAMMRSSMSEKKKGEIAEDYAQLLAIRAQAAEKEAV